jgi:hypothetical protein
MKARGVANYETINNRSSLSSAASPVLIRQVTARLVSLQALPKAVQPRRKKTGNAPCQSGLAAQTLAQMKTGWNLSNKNISARLFCSLVSAAVSRGSTAPIASRMT